MNKSQLIDKISDDSNISKTEAERAVDAFMTAVSDALTAGDTVSLRGFGTFAVQA
ncbi:MAG: HU family DNA-binding protein, partial [Cyanobacteria bacterium P01_H01_bin.15]